jgi:hypothetical protein
VIGLDTLKAERDDLKKALAAIDIESKELDAKVRGMRQREIQTKREIEALDVLIELQQSRVDDSTEK